VSDPTTVIKSAAVLGERKPPWLKVRAPGGDTYRRVKQTITELRLHTVCQEARCPNVGECWGAGTATVMLLGDTCTRGCRFCAVAAGKPAGVVDSGEPLNVARAVAKLGLRYVVLTMVTRDDLDDGGAGHVAETVTALREQSSSVLVETLVGDFAGDAQAIDTVLEARPDVFAHNVEVSRRLTRTIRDHRFSYDRSLEVLSLARARGLSRFVKSGFMVGLGEGDDEVYETLSDLYRAGAEIVTIGQYLRPSARHAPVVRYVEPERFSEYERVGRELGFAFVASGPLVRSSYHAAEGFVAARLRPASSHPARVEDGDLGTTDRTEAGVTPAHGPAVVEPSALVRSRR